MCSMQYKKKQKKSVSVKSGLRVRAPTVNETINESVRKIETLNHVTHKAYAFGH